MAQKKTTTTKKPSTTRRTATATKTRATTKKAATAKTVKAPTKRSTTATKKSTKKAPVRTPQVDKVDYYPNRVALLTATASVLILLALGMLTAL